ncbi:MAG TPA: endonuclease/exonuclease/phosphatase family protein [Gemmatimonadales bacterium]|nr:endonuclease/exonuclease/phosphatase family protein [Gemmatimonadales bacterium]
MAHARRDGRCAGGRAAGGVCDRVRRRRLPADVLSLAAAPHADPAHRRAAHSSASSKERRIRLITWNCCRGADASKLQRVLALEPDIAVLQECAAPAGTDLSTAWFVSNPKQGVAVVARRPFHVSGLPARAASRSMFAARVRGPVSFTVIAVWSQLEPTYAEALRRGVAVYEDVLRAGPCVLIGDFNSSAAWDDRHRRNDHRELDTSLREQFGLVSAYHAATGEAPGRESLATHYWRWQETAPFHLDYCYLPERWCAGLTSVTVGTYGDWAGVSDHRPVVVDVTPPG